MWMIGAPFLWSARRFRSLAVWFVVFAQRARAQLRLGDHSTRRRDPRPRPRSVPRVDLRERTARSSSTVLAAVVSSETPPGTPRRTVTTPTQISPADIEQTVSLLHDLGGLLVIDLSGAVSPPLAHCEMIATAWPSGTATSTPTRLAILVKFAHWALLRTLLAPDIERLAGKGVEARLCYEEQRWEEWLREGRIVHDVGRVLNTLSELVERQRAEGTRQIQLPHWKILLATAAALQDGSSPDELCELTRIALGCGANKEALDFADEVLRCVPKGSVLECRALRLLGVALLRQGFLSGVHALEDALHLATIAGASLEAAEARNELRQYPGEHAERRTGLRDRLAENPLN